MIKRLGALAKIPAELVWSAVRTAAASRLSDLDERVCVAAARQAGREAPNALSAGQYDDLVRAAKGGDSRSRVRRVRSIRPRG